VSFKSNPNKDYLRGTYDRAIIARWHDERRAPLRYLGLPGPDMLDIKEWQDFLDFFTTIERSEDEQHKLFLSANVRDVEHRLHSLHGDFDKILLTGRDGYNHTPRWPYDLVNLDFYGGFIYHDLARPRAIEKLVGNQRNYKRSFLLIITHDLRDADLTGEKQAFLTDIRRLLRRDHSGSDIETAVDWYLASSTPDAARQALYMNIVLRDLGEANQFKVQSRPAITYIGTGSTKMIHYVTEFHWQPQGYRAVSDQSFIDVFNLGYCELRNQQLIGSGHPRIAPSTEAAQRPSERVPSPT
jgi:hypothetical protein